MRRLIRSLIDWLTYEPATTFAVIYVAMFIITFGRVWNAMIGTATDGGALIIASVFSSTFWPLYWSVQLWK